MFTDGQKAQLWPVACHGRNHYRTHPIQPISPSCKFLGPWYIELKGCIHIWSALKLCGDVSRQTLTKGMALVVGSCPPLQETGIKLAAGPQRRLVPQNKACRPGHPCTLQVRPDLLTHCGQRLLPALPMITVPRPDHRDLITAFPPILHSDLTS